MKRCRLFLTLCTFLFFSAVNAQNKVTANPLLIHSNNYIQFDKINPRVIREAVSKVIQLSDERVKKINSIPENKHTVANTLMAMDELSYELVDLAAKLDLIASTYTNDSTRNTANQEIQKISEYGSNLYLNTGLYKAIKQFAVSSGKQLSASEKKFLNETIVLFEKNGMKLNDENKEKLKSINKKIISYGTDFDKNIAESKDSISFSLQDLAGVPEATIAPWKRDNGYTVYVNGPNYVDILKYADKENTRHTMMLLYYNRAYPENIKALDSLFYYRQQLANILSFRSYAEYALLDKMAAKPENVWKFENDLIEKLTPHVTKELNELKELKKSLYPNMSDSVYEWDLYYLTNKLLNSKYQLNTDELKQYFEMNNTVQGMFTVYQKLFNIQIKEIHDVPVWYQKVKSYELFMEGKKMGTFYLDLYPRQDKYTHFACFGISQYRLANGKEVLPVAALVCNFPEGTADKPSLLSQDDVVTLFHEFGHLVDGMLGRSAISSQGPFGVKGDFVEAPSQFLENWVWEYASLKLFAKNYKTGEVLPESLFLKLKATQKVGVAWQYIRQVYYGVLDFTYEDKYDSIKNIPLVKVARDLSSIRQVPYVSGSNFICSFGHLNSYGANYYGYLWSKVFAEDMFSVFKKEGVMNTKTGIRYRKSILEKGATEDELEMLRKFLGREPNSDAFLESLGIE